MTEIMQTEPTEITELLALAVEKGADVKALTALVSLYERVEDRRAETELTAALLAFQAQCPAVAHNKTSQFHDQERRVISIHLCRPCRDM